MKRGKPIRLLVRCAFDNSRVVPTRNDRDVVIDKEGRNPGSSGQGHTNKW